MSIRANQLALFAKTTRYHLDNNPETWRVVKHGSRWRVVNAAGDEVISTGRKTDAEQELLPGSFARNRWVANDEWLRGISTDPRLRPLDDDEKQVVASVLVDADETTNAGNCPECYSWDDDLTFRGGICETCYLESNEPHKGHWTLFGQWFCDTCNSPYCELA